MSDLLIHFALDQDNRTVRPEDGDAGGIYRCGECQARVDWYRASEKVERREHFHHFPGSDCGGGGRETDLHRNAKGRAATILNDYLAGDRKLPFYTSACEDCGLVRDFRLPEPTIRAKEEVTLPSGLRPDVWCGYAVEILVHHAVDVKKAGVFLADKVGWWEFEAKPLLDGDLWVSTKKTPRGSCPVCVWADVAALQEKGRAAENYVATASREAAGIRRMADQYLLGARRTAEEEATKYRETEALLEVAVRDQKRADETLERAASIMKPVGEFRDKLAFEEAVSLRKVEEARASLVAKEKGLVVRETALAGPRLKEGEAKVRALIEEYVSIRRQTAAARRRLEEVRGRVRIYEPE
jgi:hypothetical protein